MMRKIFILFFLLLITTGWSQTIEIRNLEQIRENVKQKIYTLNDSLIIVDSKLDSLKNVLLNNQLNDRLENASKGEVISIAKKGANLVSEPFNNSSILYTVKEDSQVILKSFNNNFYETCIGNQCGYIHLYYIVENEETENLKIAYRLNEANIKEQKQKDALSNKVELKLEKKSTKLEAYLKSYVTPFKFPSDYSLKLDNFNKEDVEILGYSNGFFKFRNAQNVIAYFKYNDVEYSEDLKNELENKSKKRAKKEGYDIFIRGANVINVNSAGGVDIQIDWIYLNKKKDIKYIEFTFLPYNNVSDVQSTDIGGYTRFTGQATGPIKAMEDFGIFQWNNAWYNSSITCIKIVKVKVDYMDGSSYVYINEISKILDSNYSNTCK
jgi:hypothetical protein